jgi:DNA-binding CsgD family transcriptional regulator
VVPASERKLAANGGGTGMQSLAERGLQFIERCASCAAAEAVTEFLQTIDQMGFPASACGAWAGVGRNRKVRFFFVTWPKDWIEFYESNGFVEHDLVPVEARRRIGPFWFNDVVRHYKLSSKQKELWDAGVAYGWTDVFAVPIHGPGSMQGLVTMATRELLAPTPADCAVPEMMARAVWERCRASEGFGMFPADRVQLSAREIECLQWAAAGKSDADIAVLVGIQPATAHFHIEQAKKRLGVKTRVEAVAVGTLHGVI